ncbi:Protein mpe1 [Massospora cicadina]|nr:Protein mpe1 [Massospora cicadina]
MDLRLTISLFELKRDILIDSKLKGTDFDIIISNAQSDEDYSDDTQLIPKNTSVYVRRVPAKPGGPNAQYYLSAANTSNDNASKREVEARPEATSVGGLEPSLDLGLGLPLSLDGVLPGESEEDKLKSLFDQSSMQWGQQPLAQTTAGFSGGNKLHNGSYRGGHFQGVPLSSTYICHRCGIKGHYVQNCPSIYDKKLAQPKVKRTTGIPRSFLKNVEAIPEGKGAMITNDGALVVAQTNDSNAWKKFQLTQRGSAISSDILRETATVPAHLSCNLCHKLLTGAVSVPCITEALLEKPAEDQFVCPSCEKREVVPDSLVVEHSLRSQVDEHLRLWAIELQGDLLSPEPDQPGDKEAVPTELDVLPVAEPAAEPQKIVPILDSSEDREFTQRPARNFGGNRAQNAELITLASDANFDLKDAPTFQPNILPGNETPPSLTFDAPPLRWTYGGGMTEAPLSSEEVARLNKLPIPFADRVAHEPRNRSKERQRSRRDPRHSSPHDSHQRARLRPASPRNSRSPSIDDRRHRAPYRQDRVRDRDRGRQSSSRLGREEPRARSRSRSPSRTRIRSRRPSPDRRHRIERRSRCSPKGAVRQGHLRGARALGPLAGRDQNPLRPVPNLGPRLPGDLTPRSQLPTIHHQTPHLRSECRFPAASGKDVADPQKSDILSRVGPANALPLASRLGHRVQDIPSDAAAKKHRKSRQKDTRSKLPLIDSPPKPIKIAHISKRD